MKVEKLEEFNEWWYTNTVPSELAPEYKRKLFSELRKFLSKRQIIAIVGLRRTGKTTLMYQLIQSLLRETDSKNILYFSFDEATEDLSEVLNTYREANNKDFRNDKIYVFLDEVQKLDNWQNQIKKYYDLYPKLKFVVSGSGSLFVKMKGRETLAGRLYEFPLRTLTFREYVEILEGTVNLPVWKMKSLCRDYILKGGFPEVVREEQSIIKRYVRSSVIDKVIFKDILSLSGLRDQNLLISLLELLASNPGMYIQYQSLAQKLGRDRRVIRDYINWLEDGFLIKQLSVYRKNKPAASRKTKRAYLADTAIIAAYEPAISQTFFGRMVENAVIIHTRTSTFWKNSYEVDAVVDGKPVEVKYRKKIADSELRGVREFMRKFSVSEGIVVTEDDARDVKVEEGVIKLVPAYRFLLD